MSFYLLAADGLLMSFHLRVADGLLMSFLPLAADGLLMSFHLLAADGLLMSFQPLAHETTRQNNILDLVISTEEELIVNLKITEKNWRPSSNHIFN